MSKICELCNKPFPIKLKLNGKVHNLCNRKYCLECSPFKQHNTKNKNKNNDVNLQKDDNGNVIEKICTCCKELKPITDFYLNKRKTSRHAYCKRCMVKLTLKRQREFKKMCVDHKGGKCEICGYDKCLAALDFHHLDPSQKDNNITRWRLSNYKNNEKLFDELDKCILVCSNCHRELHWDRDANLNLLEADKFNYSEPI